ncbi:hypothetical protein ACJRO7_010421 [Eucalyptus globulus]|uniref:Uncharacterized protein n=1 Tax=Eucalyptus globulus TaxID=34317 RepID=A0ABD3LLX7_EUCGL
MLAKESSAAAAATFELPEEVLEVLPADPFEQLDVARKITSIALSTRVSALEAESSDLRAGLAEKDDLIAYLQSRVESLDASLGDALDKLSRSELDKENLVEENELLAGTVKKLSRDVSKLEIFKKTLMQSLQEDEESSGPARAGASQIIAKPTPSEDDAPLPPRSSSIRSQSSEVGNSLSEDRETDVPRPGTSYGYLLASQTSTPRFTPPGSPPSLSASVSPTRTSKPPSPRRNAMSFSTSRGMFDERSSIYSSVPPGHHGSITSSESGSYTGKPNHYSEVPGHEPLVVRAIWCIFSQCEGIEFSQAN